MKATLEIMFALFFASILLSASFKIQPIEASGTIYIKPESIDPIIVPDDYPTIQEAINNADYGSTIYVRAGIYHENIVVNKSITLVGENTSSTIIDGEKYGSDPVVSITTNNVTIAKFTIQNSTAFPDIFVTNCDYVQILNNSLKSAPYKIHLENTERCLIEGNEILGGMSGIKLVDSSNNKIASNTVFRCNSYNLPIGPFYGISLEESTMNEIGNNVILENDVGISLSNSNSNRICHNVISGEWPASYPAYDAEKGIKLSSNSHDNYIIANEISNMTQTAIVLTQSSSIFYHNNFINNTNQVELTDSFGNVWNDDYPSGGNYWSDYVGSDEYRGVHQNLTGSDGIGDTSYIIDVDNNDAYPLMKPWLTPWGNWSHYHDYTETIFSLLYLNDLYPNVVDVFPIGKSWQDRDIYCIRLTNESNTNPKPQVFFVGYHHAREPITAELTLYFTVDAVTNFGTNTTITQMLNRSEIYIVPALNVDGFNLFKENDWQRKNARPTNEDGDSLIDEDPPEDENLNGFVEALWNLTNGMFIRWEGPDNDGDGQYGEDWIGGVDLNRNYDYQWQGGSSNPKSEIYKGPAPFSEPETQAIRDLVLSCNFTYAISFHSGAELILYPWGYTSAPTPDDAKFIEIAQDLSNITGGTTYMQSNELYPSYGTWDDWMYGTKNIFALTCEIFTNDTFEFYSPGPYPDTIWEGGVKYWFNPFPNQIPMVIQRWLPVFFNITNRAISEAYQHDIGITDAAAKKVVEYGFTTTINVTVMNKGLFTESFNVTLYANTTLLGSKTVVLPSKNYQTIAFTWNTSSYSKGNYTLKAIADTVNGEVETTDNTLINGQICVTKVGDLGGGTPPQFYKCDGKVDSKDLSLFLQCYKRTAPTEAWYLADLGGGTPPKFYMCDGKVDSKDLSLFLQCYKGIGPDTL